MTHHREIDITPALALRLATLEDRPALEELKAQSIKRLLEPFLNNGQKRTMHEATPFDPCLIEDGTYYVVTVNGRIAASGGWSRRCARIRMASAFGSRDLVDPATGAAGIRAMFVHPDFARRGLGSLLLTNAESAARLAGFRKAELIATTAGEKLYRAHNWKVEDRLTVGPPGHPGVPASRMTKRLG